MLVIASDHGGFAMKEQLCAHLRERGVEFEDIGCHSEEGVDYPLYAEKAGKAVAAGIYDRGVLVCGTGIGMAIAACKINGVRAVNIINTEFAALSREHNDANLITLSGRFIDEEINKAILDTFLSTEFGGGRHAGRVEKIMNLETK